MYKVAVSRGFLDPRTKCILLLLTAVFCLGGAGGQALAHFRLGLSFVPYALLFIDRKWKAGAGGLCLLVLSYLYLHGFYTLPPLHQLIASQVPLESLHFILILLAAVFTRLLPSLAMGSYTFRTTSVSEFTAAMKRIHAPDALVIPMSVMFRLFPTVRENAKAIREAMTMRGIRVHPFSKYIEYRMVPLVESTAAVGDDLSASALMRGLGAPGGRTDICRIGFRKQDISVFLILLFLLAF